MSNIIISKKEYTPDGLAVIKEDAPKATEIMSIKDALDGYLINQMSDDDLYNDLADVVGTAYIIMDYKAPGSVEADIMLKEIRSELRRKPVNIRRHELIIAVKEGLSGAYGEVIGLSANKINKFIYAYSKDAQRINELEIRNMRSGPKPPPSKDEQFKLSLSNAVAAFNEFLKTGTSDRFGSPCYEFLTKYGILNVDTPQKKEYYSLAEKRVKGDLEYKMEHSKSKAEHDYLKDQLSRASKGLIIATSKRLIVDDLFRGYAKNGTDLTEVVNAAREFYED